MARLAAVESSLPEGIEILGEEVMERESKPNPFETIYLTEALRDPDLYWDLFSPEIVTGEAKQLFQRGNVVLLGSNGTGKTMLLRLFDPAVQVAYLQKGKEIPIPEESRRFLSIGINFVSAAVGTFGGRRVTRNVEDNLDLWGRYFGDFLNYFLVGELLQTLEFISAPECLVLTKHLGSRTDAKSLDEFSRRLAGNACWFGAMKEISSLREIMSLVRERISIYRAFANWNMEALPEAISRTKTDIGIPLIESRKELENLEILGATIPLMVTIDQYETLLHIDYETALDPSKSIGRVFCRVVNSLMSSRSPEVSFKVGVRPYSWDREMRAFGTDARLELGRDYQKVNLDDLLRRKENRSSWIFPEFASDVAGRRIAKALGGDPKKYETWFTKALEELSTEDELGRYCANVEDRLLPRHPEWPESWNNMLAELYAESKFEAKLAEVWLAQRTRTMDDDEVRGEGGKRLEEAFGNREWKSEYWAKERREALLTRIASSCRQRRLYGGWEAVLTLSGDNILVFLSLCREIWHIRERVKAESEGQLEKFSIDVQAQAIRSVSESWLKKQTEFPGGSRRQDFVKRLAVGIRKGLEADSGLVYPGRNGFSLLEEEYESQGAQGIRDFLANATDFGALVSSQHTTKESDKRPRRKWYIFPVLCPNLDIPAIRTKEPYYASLAEVRHWLDDEKRPGIRFRGLGQRQKQWRSSAQGSLFDAEEE